MPTFLPLVFVSFAKFFLFAQFLTHKCKHLSGKASKASVDYSWHWLVHPMSEKCINSPGKGSPLESRGVGIEQNVHERELHHRKNKSIPEVGSQDLQAGWSSNQEASIKSMKPESQVRKPRPCWQMSSDHLKRFQMSFSTLLCTHTLFSIYEGWGGFGKSSVHPPTVHFTKKTSLWKSTRSQPWNQWGKATAVNTGVKNRTSDPDH